MKTLQTVALLSLSLVSAAANASLECKSSGKYLSIQSQAQGEPAQVDVADYSNGGYLNQFVGTCATVSGKKSAEQRCDSSTASVQVIASGKELLVYSVLRAADQSLSARVLSFELSDCSFGR